MIDGILEKTYLEKGDIKQLLSAKGEDMQKLFAKAKEVKFSRLDNNVHLRGLIEYSNICTKSCLYCGIRSKNTKTARYTLTEDEVLECAERGTWATLKAPRCRVGDKVFYIERR